MGDSFIWLTRDNVDLNQPIGTVVPTLVGLESLRTLKLACVNLGISDAQVEQIFYDNAAALFGQSNIDGGLIGGASLNAEHFAAICKAAA